LYKKFPKKILYKKQLSKIMNPSTESLLEETTKLSTSINDDYAAQRQRRQICLNDAKRRRTCEGSAAEVAKLLKDELNQEENIQKKNGSEVNLHRLRVMNHTNYRKFSENRGVNIPFDISDIKRTLSAQPCLTTTDDLSPVSRVTSDNTLPPNERSLSGSHSFLQRSSDSDGNSVELMDIRIFFPDSRCVQFPVEGGSQARADDLLRLVAEHERVPYDVASNVFALWLTSPLLEVQLKPHHIAAEVRNKWSSFLRKYTYADEADIVYDEPLLILKRNVSLTIDAEERYVQDYEEVVDLLYSDAKDEYLSGRYLVDVEGALELAALQILIEFGPYEEKEDEVMDLLHYRLADFVPAQHLSHVRSFHLFGIAIMECKAGLEKEVFQRYKDFSAAYGSQSERKNAYLELLRATPFYGAAFFDGKIDRRSSSNPLFDIGKRLFTAYMPSSKMNVRIGIQSKCITVVDPIKHEILLTTKIEDSNWLSNKDDKNSEFFLHFPDPKFVAQQPSQHFAENGQNIDAPPSKILQVFSNQTCMMVALLDSLLEIAVSELGSANDLRQAIISDSDNGGMTSSDETEVSPNSTVMDCLTSSRAPSIATHSIKTHSSSSSKPSKAPSKISNRTTNSRLSSSSRDSFYDHCKLSKLCLATLDSKGCCIEAHGSLKKIFVPVH
jgi:hypothetical protein